MQQASAEKIWTAAQQHLRSMLSNDTYNLWFAPLRAVAHENSSIVLEVANDFCEVWLKENYLSLLKDVIAVSSGRQLDVKFRVGAGNAPAPTVSSPAPAPKTKAEPAERSGTAAQELNFNP